MEQLVGCLDRQREHVVGIIGGLSEEELRRPVLPSGWHCLGLVRHLTIANERYWFDCVVGGAPFDDLPWGPRADWSVGPGETAAAVLADYRRAIERADEVLAATAADAPPKQRDPAWADWGMDVPDVRAVLLHVIAETAAHAGHLDAVRELIDGRQWIVLD